MSPVVLRTVFGSCLALGLVDLAWLDTNAARLSNDGSWELLTRPRPMASAERLPVTAATEPPSAALNAIAPSPASTGDVAPAETTRRSTQPEPPTSCVVQFERSLSALPPDQAANLTVIAEAMKNDPRTVARISGHADRMGWKANRGDNLTLSENRARAVERALGRLGIAPDRIKRAAFGDTRPVDERTTEDAYRRNRRVEVRVESTGDH